jgi:hypothetical protein
MKTNPARILFWLCLILFLMHQSGSAAISHPLTDAYLDDLLCMPVCLFPVLSGFRFLLGKAYRFPLSYLIGVWLFFSIYFEFLLPQYNSQFTADWTDVICYALSTGLFAVMQNPTTAQKNAPLLHE